MNGKKFFQNLARRLPLDGNKRVFLKAVDKSALSALISA